jgi:2-polyprenyl-6-methoxyphenol hydroxylase-like FAD-dependent oxidoreductase
MKYKQTIVILGGGTAGWMCANLLQLKLAPLGFKIQLVESEEIGIIGVGEGSTPQLKVFFDQLGISESTWMPQCDATYKYGIHFDKWCTADPKRPFLDSYFHPFPASSDGQTAASFMQACHTMLAGFPAATLPDPNFLTHYCQSVHITPPELHDNHTIIANYGYHFDSYKLGAFLSAHAQTQGVIRICDTIVDVRTNANGIAYLTGQNGQQYHGDWFIDCSGFRARLIQEALGVPFTSFASELRNNRAVAIATPSQANAPMATRATALKHGWAWRIPLTSRTGNGYVYCDEFCSPEDAEAELRRHLNDIDNIDASTPARHLQMKVGQVASHWDQNCVAVGLAQGFIEPLEATALHLVQETVTQFIGAFIAGEQTARYRDAFNDNIKARFTGIKDYINAHYQCSNRTDTAYWRDVSQAWRATHHVQQLRNVWQQNGNIAEYLTAHNLHHYYPAVSWYCLFAGYQQFNHRQYQQPVQSEALFTQLLQAHSTQARPVGN